MAWILARKVEMTRVMKEDKFIPVTLLEVPAMKVVGYKTLEKDGYQAVIVGIVKKDDDIKLKKGKAGLSKDNFSILKEFDIKDVDLEKFAVWDDITLDVLEGISEVTIVGISKGRWFTGAMKKHNFHGWPASHGSKFHRALGSIGNRKPVRTHKGKKMHGHHGVDTITLRNISIEIINKDIKVIGVRWPIPGARNSLVSIVF